MALTRDLTVRLLADTSSLNAGINKASGPMGKLSGTVGKLASGFIALGAATVAVDFLGEATTAAREDEKAQALLAQTLENTTQATVDQVAATEAWIENLMFATGVADEKLRPALGVLVTATGDITEAQALMATALDIAAARGLDLETVALALAKAQDGQTTSLSRLGIQIKDTSGATLEFDQIMANAAETFGGSAATAAETSAGKMAILKLKFDEAKEAIGKFLNPVIEDFVELMTEGVLPAFELVAPVLMTVANIFKTQLTSAINAVMLVMEPLMHLVKGEWSEAWDAFRDRLGKAWKGIVDLVRGPVDLVVGIVEGMVDAVNVAVEKIVNYFLSIPKRIAGLGGKILAEITGGAGGLVGKALNVIGLAEGGLVTKPTLAVVGEKGPEVVMPVDGGLSFDRSGIAPLGAMNGGGGGSTTVYVQNMYVTGDGDQIVRQLQTYNRRNGAVPIDIRPPT